MKKKVIEFLAIFICIGLVLSCGNVEDKINSIISSNDINKMKRLIEDEKNIDLNSILIKSIENNRLEMTKLLVSKGADLNAKYKDGNSILHLAVDEYQYKLDLNFLKYLISNCDLNLINNEGLTPLHLAVLEDNQLIVNLLISKGADINCKDFSKKTPLHIAASKKDNKTIQILIDKANLEAKDNEGNTPLANAARYKDNFSNITLLINKGANINATNMYGRTPLHLAASHKNQVNYNVLANYNNVNKKIKDKDGKTAEDLFLDSDIDDKTDEEIQKEKMIENMKKARLEEYFNKN